MLLLNFTKVYIFSITVLVIGGIVVVFSYYLTVHYENKEKSRPKPVYLADPEY